MARARRPWGKAAKTAKTATATRAAVARFRPARFAGFGAEKRSSG